MCFFLYNKSKLKPSKHPCLIRLVGCLLPILILAIEDYLMKPLSGRDQCLAASSKLSMHKDSHVISKFKPKIRIIHTFAPEIIKTDVANFRELVETLTGKPTDHRKCCSKKKSSKTKHPISKDLSASNFIHESSEEATVPNFLNGENIAEEERNERSWDQGKSTSNGLTFDGFTDLDGFIQELRDGFPSIPMKSSNSDAFQL